MPTADCSTNPEPLTPRARRGVAAAVVVGALWRLGVLVFDKWNQPLLLNDSIYYTAQAKQLAQGVWFREVFVDQPGAEHGPLTSLLMAPVSWVSYPEPWQRLITVVCGVVAIVVLAFVALRVGGQRAAVAAAWIAAVYPNLWMNDGLIMAESVSTLCVAAMLLAALRWREQPSLRRAVVIGVVLGLSTLARSELVLAVPLVAAWCLWCVWPDRRMAQVWRAPLLVMVMAGVTLAPWVVFNLVRFERPVLLTTNDGTTLRGTYCDAAFYGADLGNWSLLCVADPAGVQPDDDPSVRSAVLRTQAFEYMGDNLGRVPVVVAARLARAVDLFRLDRLVDQDEGEERYRWASWAGIVCWWVLAPLAVLGLRRIDRHSRRLLLVPAVVVFVTTVLFYGAHRIRSPLESTVVVGAAVALAGWLAARQRSEQAPATGVEA